MRNLLKKEEELKSSHNIETEKMKILNFSQYLMEGKKFIRTAGVAILYGNKILLVHPTGGSWKTGTCGIPKGGIEDGEDEVDAALRETYEETGITLDRRQLELSPEVVDLPHKNKQLTYFVCRVRDLSEIGLTNERVPKSQLQLKEIDWAGFVPREEAYSLMSQNQLIILDRLL
jgi:predicted NUDIX family NTP pyrophosphohydrolase